MLNQQTHKNKQQQQNKKQATEKGAAARARKKMEIIIIIIGVYKVAQVLKRRATGKKNQVENKNA